MGLLTVAVAVATFLAAAAAAWLAPPTWLRALFVTLSLAPLTALTGLGWWLRRRSLRRGAASWTWALPAGVVAALTVGASFAFGLGPARIPRGGPVTIELPAWALAGAGLAGVVASLGYGLALAASRSWAAAAAGVLLAVGGLLALMPALRDAGLPTVGPLGMAVAVAAVLASRLWPR